MAYLLLIKIGNVGLMVKKGENININFINNRVSANTSSNSGPGNI